MSGIARVLVTLGLAAAVLTGCSGDPNSVAEQARSGSRKGYISGDGRVEMIPADRRAAPVTLEGTLLDGAAWTSTAARGKPLVVNVWASWCGPCAAEAPVLRSVSEAAEFTGKVGWIGINLREPAPNGLAQVKAWRHTYPSLSDQAGVTLLALQGKAAAMPSTLVLDSEGRIAARILGPVTSSTLTGMIEDVLSGSTTS